MAAAEKNGIRLVVEDEQSLYTTFSPEDEFSDPVKAYIRSKIVGQENNRSLNMTVMSREPIDEERFRSAVRNWIESEKILFRAEEQKTLRMLIALLIFGSIMIIMCISLESRLDVLKYSLLPIIGSLSLSRAAAILIIDMPTIRAKKWILSGMEKKNVITFEYDNYGGSTPENTAV